MTLPHLGPEKSKHSMSKRVKKFRQALCCLNLSRPEAAMKLEALRTRVHDIVDELGDDDSRRFELFILILIALNVLTLIVETVDSIGPRVSHWIGIFDAFSVGIFTVEYLTRLWACTANPRFAHPLWGRLRYMLTPYAIVDLLAILPFWLPLLGLYDLRQLRAVRLLRLFKIFRYSRSLNLFVKVFWQRRRELLVILILLMLQLLFASSVMYYIEHDAQPEKFASIPAAMWWAIATLTTVGYGDVFPVTPLGQFVAAFIAVLGIGMFALPTGILGAAFVEELDADKRKTEAAEAQLHCHFCPHCGEKLPTQL
ncbi:MAG: ion transporter [Candidatus Sericytochromatia bacterium]